MWLFTRDGFFSIVEDKTNENNLLVRARVKGDLEKLFPGIEVREEAGTDYRYRASVTRQEAADRIGQMISWITYGNFKASIRDKRRSKFYDAVWQIMAMMQMDFARKEETNGGEEGASDRPGR